jgi:hypothetical protein
VSEYGLFFALFGLLVGLLSVSFTTHARISTLRDEVTDLKYHIRELYLRRDR